MPDPNLELLASVRSQQPMDSAVADCWDLLMEGIEIGWIDVDELRQLLAHLRDGRDWGTEDLLFANLGDDLRVSFVGDKVVCARTSFVDELATLLARVTA